jgi:hypothetical protein
VNDSGEKKPKIFGEKIKITPGRTGSHTDRGYIPNDNQPGGYRQLFIGGTIPAPQSKEEL